MGRHPPCVGHRFEAPEDQSRAAKVLAETRELAARRESVSKATGDLVGAALSLAGNLLGDAVVPPAETVDMLAERLSQCVDRDESGKPQLKVSLENEDALRGVATTLAKLLTVAGQPVPRQP